MGDAGKTIIIKGGSVGLIFDPTSFERDSMDPYVHTNKHAKITRIVVENMAGGVEYDTGYCQEGLQSVVMVAYE